MTAAAPSKGQRRVCLVGAGKVAAMHVPALALTPGAALEAVYDTDQKRARSLAARHRIPNVFGSLEEAIASRTFEFAHVLVPPDRHVQVAQQLIEGGVGVLIEKPMGQSAMECQGVVELANRREVRVGVNHNSVFYPAYLRLRRAVLEQTFGALRHLVVTVHRPRHWLLRTHPWLHERPGNLVYESAVHPLAQVYDLAGPASEVSSVVSARHEQPDGCNVFGIWQASLVCERATAQLSLSYGDYPTYQVLAICDDGVLTVEVEENRFTATDRTRWARTRFGRYLQPLRVARRAAGAELAYGLENVVREARSAQRGYGRSDAYALSMQRSIAAFHRGPGTGEPLVDGAFGGHVVALCDRLAATSNSSATPGRRKARTKRLNRPDVALIGGTGLIGRALLEQLTAEGRTVRVLARHIADLPPVFSKRGVELVQGDLTYDDTPDRVARGARAAVHLGDRRELISWGNVTPALLEPALSVARSCVRGGVEQLLCTGSLTSLDLGDREATITGTSPVDLRASSSGAWEWGKARQEQILREFASAESLRLSVFRPGVVVGAGMELHHPGFGVWRGVTHCVGWNAGLNSLPLVLASDVAAAIRLALDSDMRAPNTYNLIGDVRLSARECVEELSMTLRRPLVFHPAHPGQHHALAVAKWCARRSLRGERAPFPAYRAFASKGCLATFDCSDVKHCLGWRPVAERSEFVELGLRAVR